MASVRITGSVGLNAKNNITDIKAIQSSLNDLLHLIPPTKKLAVDGSLGRKPENSKTVSAIKLYQQKVVGMVRPDAVIDPNGRSHRSINLKLTQKVTVKTGTTLPAASPKKGITEDDYNKAAKSLDCEVAVIKAVAEVETSGDPFLISGKPKILFEAHIFSRNTGNKYDTTKTNISSRSWNRALYKGGEKEYDRLKEAMELDRLAALKSASWGRFQIMGFNHKASGFTDVESFVKAMFKSEAEHLNAFVSFIKSNKLDNSLKNKDWASFAKGYNGSSYKENKYDTKLKTAYEKFSKKKG